MAFIDELKIYAKAGNGGNGVVRWRQEKFIAKGGPAGGDGGRGGDICVRATRDIHILAKYRNLKKFYAENGEAGGSHSLHGKSGEDLVLELPVGSVITKTKDGTQYSLVKEGQQIVLLSGGYGGFGNEHFKSSTNTTPEEWTPGKNGEEGDFFIELQLFADIGLVGLPNAGKSSFLNAVTNATAKIGDYQFTTLDPNLGDLFGYIIADIPGLIEGASEGKGLGTKFLRHIKRTKMIAHLVSFENEDMMNTYETIRNELKTYDTELAHRDEIILLTKTDVVDKETIEKKRAEFEKLGKSVFTISLYDDESIKHIKDELVKMLREKEQHIIPEL